MNTELAPKKSIPELSVDTQLIIARLKKLEKGDFIEYAELSKIVNGDIQRRNRCSLDRARHRLLKDERMVFEVVQGKGIKRINDVDSIGIGTNATRRVRRLSRKAAEKMMCTDYEKLSREDRVEFNTQISVLGALCVITQTNKIKSIQTAVEQSQEKLALNKTLELFKG